jgi:hypothetical protein
MGHRAKSSQGLGVAASLSVNDWLHALPALVTGLADISWQKVLVKLLTYSPGW